MTTAPTTDLALGTTVNSQGSELATTGAAAKEQHEIQSAIIIARRFPRNEEACFQKLMKACNRLSFADDATYSFPRGDQDISGPSVHLAREAGRIWGNIRFGLYIVREDDESMMIRGWAWDVETNTKVEHDDSFKKLIQRKGKGWIVPDERDLRELVNRRGAILVRNSLLQVMPKDLIEDALFACQKALQASAKDNPEAARKRLLVDFGAINVTVEQLEKKLGHPFAQSTPKEIAELRGICKSIIDGNSTWAEYVKDDKGGKAASSDAENKQMDDIREQLKQAKAETLPDPPRSKKATESQTKQPAKTNAPVASADKEPPSQEATPGTVTDETWGLFIEYIDDDTARAQLKKHVKEKMQLGNLRELKGEGRVHFILTMQDQAKKAGIPFEIYVKE